MANFAQSMRLLAHKQKSAGGVSPYSTLVNRPVGRVIAAAMHARGASPNQVTTLSAMLTLGAVVLLVAVPPQAWLGAVVWALLALGFAADSADGQVARLSGTSSPVGEWYDHMVDATKMVLLHGAVMIGWYRFSAESGAWLLVPIAFQAVAVATFSGLTIVGLMKRLAVALTGEAATRPTGAARLRSWALLPVDYGVLCLAFLLWGAPDAFAGVYLTLLVLNALALVLFLVKWTRELARLPVR